MVVKFMVMYGRIRKNKSPTQQIQVNLNLVGGWTNPSEKYARQIGNLPQVGVNIKNTWNYHLIRTVSTKIRYFSVFFG